MLSGARGIAALMLALALAGAVWTAALHQPELLPARDDLSLMALPVGGVFGWTMIGGHVGAGFFASSGRALSAVFLAGVSLFALAAGRSVLIGMRYNAFPDPMQALDAFFVSFVIHMGYALDMRVILAAAIGALIAGIIAEYCSMIWN